MLFAVACCSLSLAVRCRSLFAVARRSLLLSVRCRLLFAVAGCSLSLDVRCCSLFIVACCPLSPAVPCRFLFAVACCSLALAVRCRFLFAVARSFFPRSKGNAVFFLISYVATCMSTTVIKHGSLGISGFLRHQVVQHWFDHAAGCTTLAALPRQVVLPLR